MENKVANAGPWPSTLSAPILNVLNSLSLPQMTPVQKSTIPLLLGFKDVVVEAVTGSGKTLAFLIPILEMIMRKHREDETSRGSIGALIISPTRELATQIHGVLAQFCTLLQQDDVHLSHMLLIGGSSTSDSISTFKKQGAHILIGTPGRLTEELEVLVMDEADRLLDMGFEQQLTAIISKIPKQRRTGLFSATMNEGLGRLVKAGLRNPVRVSVKVHSANGTIQTEQKIPSSLQIFSLVCAPDEKILHLLHLFKSNPDEKFIVYFSTAACVDYFYKILAAHPSKPPVASLHGKMDPKRREAVYVKFTSSVGGILLCTDVAARGLDIPDIDFVIQFDPPQDPKAFAHRCGRTARIGRSGRAVVFLTPNEETYIQFLEIRNIPIAPFETPEFTTEEKESMMEFLKSKNRVDRDMLEKGIKAFVSWVRAYKEHQASYIFQIKHVDLAAVARSFGTLRLPKMPELKEGFEHRVNFQQDAIDVNSIPFLDKLREASRLKKMAENISAPKVFKKKIEAWSEKKDTKEKRDLRKLKKDRKRVAIMKKAQEVIDAGKVVVPEKRRTEDDGGDYQEYLAEKKQK